MSNFEEKAKQRLIVLKALYEITNGNEDGYVLMEILQNKCSNLDTDSFYNAIGYLDGENLLKRDMIKKGVNITHTGVKEIEDGMKNKDKPTEHFPAINYISIGTMKGSQIQQGNVDSEQTFNQQNFAQIEQILQTLKNSYKDYNLPPEKESDLLLQISTIEAQTKLSKPKTSIISSCLKSVAEIIKPVTAALSVYTAITTILTQLG